jgi:beta-phosphoglucomutase
MSGKPRRAGALAALQYFDVPDAESRADVYGAHKQDILVKLIEGGDFRAYPDALRFVLACKDAGLRIAAASSSKNAGLFLRQIRLDTFAEQEGLSYDFLTPRLTLLDAFDVDISGRDFAHGKPHPEIFLTAADELGYAPAQVFVVEDAVSGIQAAKAGGMAAVGVSRADDFDALAAQGADIVVRSLDEIDVDALRRHELVAK